MNDEFDDSRDRPVFTESVVRAVINSQKPFLEDNNNRALAISMAQKFYDDTKEWRVGYKPGDKNPERFPLLDEQARKSLLIGFYKLVVTFDKGHLLNEDLEPRYNVDRAKIAVDIKKNLRQAECIKQYSGNKESAVHALLGSTIRRAMDAAQAIGVSAPGVSHEKVWISDDTAMGRR